MESETTQQLSNISRWKINWHKLEIFRLESFYRLLSTRQIAKDIVYSSMSSNGVYFSQSRLASYSQDSRETITCACSECNKNIQINAPEQPISFTSSSTSQWASVSLSHYESCFFATGSTSVEECSSTVGKRK